MHGRLLGAGWRVVPPHLAGGGATAEPQLELRRRLQLHGQSGPDAEHRSGGRRQDPLAWDNLSENTPDPKEGDFDFRGYRLWKVSDWTPPVGSTGPSESDWTLLDQFHLFDQHRNNKIFIGPGRDLSVRSVADTCYSASDGDSCFRWPRVYIPQASDSQTIVLRAGDLWSRQSGRIIRPDRTLR